MFEPLTGKQHAYLGNLIAKVGKEKYQAIKAELGFYGLLLTQLSRHQASCLIKALKSEVRR